MIRRPPGGPMLVMWMWLTALGCAVGTPAEDLARHTLDAPELEGGSTLAVDASGRLEVYRASDGALRWAIGLGAPADHIVVDARRVYVATGRYLRAFAGGVAGWHLDLGQPAEALEVGEAGALRVQLPGGTLWVDAAGGTFCTPRNPCSGLPGYTLGSLGVPFLDLPGFGVPGLGLLVAPELLVAPGPVPGLTAPPPAPLPPRARDVAGGLVAPPAIERGRSGRARVIRAGGGGVFVPEVMPAPAIRPQGR